MSTKRFNVYAPVIIPTLCRYEHLKRCVESLRKCTGAEFTDLFLGLDYPAKEEHWIGYNLICDYINHINGFNTVVVIKRDNNLGPSQNTKLLLDLVRESYDRYIISEDDNEFSPNFLDYMNAGLAQFKENPNVIAICGANMTWGIGFQDIMHGYSPNIFPAKDYCAFGAGFWRDKHFVVPYTKEGVLKSWRLTFKAFKNSYSSIISRMLFHLNQESQYPDLCWRLYCAFHNKYCIFPIISKVKNWGYDGSGENSEKDTFLIDIQELDTANAFYMDEVEVKDYPQVVKFIKKKYGGSGFRRFSVLMRYVYYRITKKSGNGGYMFFKSILRKLRHKH